MNFPELIATLVFLIREQWVICYPAEKTSLSLLHLVFKKKGGGVSNTLQFCLHFSFHICRFSLSLVCFIALQLNLLVIRRQSLSFDSTLWHSTAYSAAQSKGETDLTQNSGKTTSRSTGKKKPHIKFMMYS